ncbi:hypothetical protein MycrhDRAFT_6608 [Mycolicibacterium rhodesiae JS60]|nr:hypothetical protein MycrhDRAFT_6608 [Mycolicibacterium rhodesiae JS60]
MTEYIGRLGALAVALGIGTAGLVAQFTADNTPTSAPPRVEVAVRLASDSEPLIIYPTVSHTDAPAADREISVPAARVVALTPGVRPIIGPGGWLIGNGVEPGQDGGLLIGNGARASTFDGNASGGHGGNGGSGGLVAGPGGGGGNGKTDLGMAIGGNGGVGGNGGLGVKGGNGGDGGNGNTALGNGFGGNGGLGGAGTPGGNGGTGGTGSARNGSNGPNGPNR